MEFNKWLKRKYPNEYQELLDNYEREYLENYLKKFKYKIGRLKKDEGENSKGSLVIYHHTKEILDGLENGYEYRTQGGWTGSFEYYYYFSKPSGWHHNSSYVKIFE